MKPLVNITCSIRSWSACELGKVRGWAATSGASVIPASLPGIKRHLTLWGSLVGILDIILGWLGA